jgi:hypothetical protein
VLRHLNTCDECRRELEQLTRVADEVLLVAPEREAPAGFDGAVLDRSWRRRPALVAAAAAVVLAFGGAAVAWQATADDRELAAAYRDTLAVANGRYFAAADLVTSDGHSAGTAFFYEGSPSWLYVIVRDAPSGTYAVAVSTGGRSLTVAECEVTENTCDAGWHHPRRDESMTTAATPRYDDRRGRPVAPVIVPMETLCESCSVRTTRCSGTG